MSLERSADLPTAITREEYEGRVGRIQEAMSKRRLDALLITSEDNYRYITGFDSPTWHNLTRPRYCIVPSVGDPLVIVPANNVEAIRDTTWMADIRSWVSPCPEDDGITLTVDALKTAVGKFNRIGAELGPQSRLTMPVGDFLRLKDMLAPIEIDDGDWMLREIRMVKSAAEVAHVRYVAQLVSHAFEALPARMGIGDTEDRVSKTLQADLLSRGVEKIPYLIGMSGAGGYDSLHKVPGQRVLAAGDVMVFDTGCTYKGYHCDFNREYAIGPLSDTLRRLYDIVWRATEAGIEAVRPGRRCADIWQAESDSLAADAEDAGVNFELKKSGRMGHGVGLRMCEPPSIRPDDETVLRPGMVLTIEPGIAFTHDGEHGPEPKCVVHEENLVVTEDGWDLLSIRAPREMMTVE